MSFFGALGSIAGGLGAGIQEGEELQTQRLQRQAQDALGRAFASGDTAGQASPMGTGVSGLGGLGQQPQPPMPGQPSQPSQPMQQPANQNAAQPPQGASTAPYGDLSGSIAAIESRGQPSGGYQAVGPVTNGDQPYGKYQVMGKNIPQWTQEALGRPLTPQQFLASPQAQDAVFKHKFGQYVQQYGSPQAAAAVWHGGPGALQPGGGAKKDNLGTSNDAYVQKFNQGLGGAQPQQGGQQPPSQGQSQVMQLAQRIQKANPGIKPGVLWQALAQAAPMMNQEAQQALKEQTLDLRAQLQTQREQSELVLHQMDDFIKGQTSEKNTQARVGAAERGQDMTMEAKQQQLQLSTQRLKMLQDNAAKAQTDKDRKFWADQADRQLKNYTSLQRALTGAEASPSPDQGQVDALKGDVAKAKPQDAGPRNEDAPAQQPAAQGADQPPMPGARKGTDGQWYVQQNGKWFRVNTPSAEVASGPPA